ncbi:MAG: SDR family NAD(P)-dependent oxidoreductase [Isosphaeraceae bacterium]|nr:SDR family NAD(P)-dependent oxidoreductase [Isosphaeraceae bacterium]
MSANGPRIVLISGASAGLGAAIARELARSGHRLALVARRADRLEGVAGEVRALGGEALALPADLADPEAPAALIAATVAQFGGLDVLINNAAFGLPDYFGHSDPEALRRQIAVNLAAPMLLTRLALPHLIAAKGTVINIGSAITCVANPIFGAYGPTKAALAYWTDALRRELRHRSVRVCLVEPGPIATEFFAAVGRLDGGDRALGIGPPPDALYNALRDRPPTLLEISAEEAARRISRLLDRPRRRLSLPRRVVWPLRLVGALFQIAPGLGDLILAAMIQRVERERADRAGQPRPRRAHARRG